MHNVRGDNPVRVTHKFLEDKLKELDATYFDLCRGIEVASGKVMKPFEIRKVFSRSCVASVGLSAMIVEGLKVVKQQKAELMAI